MHCLVPPARLSVPVTGEVFKGTETDNFIDLPEAWARLNAQEMETSPACPAAKVKTGCQDEPDSCKSQSQEMPGPSLEPGCGCCGAH